VIKLQHVLPRRAVDRTTRQQRAEDTEHLHWLAVMTQPRAEAMAERHLRRQGFRTFFPHTCEWVGLNNTKARLKKRPYLPRYLFVNLKDGQSVYDINATPGVSATVYAPGGIAFPIPAIVMKRLMALAVDVSGMIVLTESAKPKFPGKVGDFVRLAETSAFFGFLAEVCRIDDNGKMVVALERFGSMTINHTDVGEVHRTKDEGRPTA
jgi:transcription antitermination factor NusG